MVDVGQTAIFALYMLGTLAVGLYAWTKTEAVPEDFYIADRGLGRVVLGLTLLASISSSWTFFGVGAAAHGTGLAILFFIGFMLTFYGLFLAYIGVRVNVLGRRHDYLTPVEYLRDRYEAETPGILYILVCFTFLSMYIAAQIIGGGIALDLLMGIPYETAIVIMVALMAIYVHFAGMRGVVWSDVIQSVVMFVAMIAVALIAIVVVGSDPLYQGVVDSSPAAMESLTAGGIWTPRYTFGLTVVLVLGVAAYPHVYQRYLATDKAKKLKDAALIYPAVSLPLTIAGAILGVWSLGVLTDPPNADYVIPLMMEQLTNPLIAAVALSGGVAALMSTADSVILSLSSLVSRDIYKRHINPEATGREEVRVTRFVLLVVLGFALVIAYLQPSGIFELVNLNLSGFTATVPALYLSMYWSKATKSASILSILAGLAFLFGYQFNIIPSSLVFGTHFGLITLLVSLIVFVVVSYLTAGPEDETISMYFDIPAQRGD